MEKRHQKYLPVNWADGMKINKTHLVAERNALLQQVADAAASNITGINYGLLPPVAAGEQPFKLFVSLDNQQHLQVRLVHCKAVTPGGIIIDIDELNDGDEQLSAKIPDLSVPVSELKNKSSVYYVVLTVNIYDRVPAGQSHPEELPPRLPWAKPLYTLSLVPQEELNGEKAGLYHLTISRVLVNEHRVEADEDYIPPCSTVGSYTGLKEVYYGLETFMAKMELYAMQINQKIEQKKQNNELAMMVQRMCNQVLHHQSQQIPQVKWMAMHQPPAYLFSMVASLARIIKNSLDIYINAGKEDLVNYFAEWCEVNQGALETVITDLGDHQYQHEDINGTVLKVMEFTKIVSGLFSKLSKLDYIGKKRDSNIFVKEEIVATEKSAEGEAKKRRNFLAD
jgi:hypothetical protein